MPIHTRTMLGRLGSCLAALLQRFARTGETDRPTIGEWSAEWAPVRDEVPDGATFRTGGEDLDERLGAIGSLTREIDDLTGSEP